MAKPYSRSFSSAFIYTLFYSIFPKTVFFSPFKSKNETPLWRTVLRHLTLMYISQYPPPDIGNAFCLVVRIFGSEPKGPRFYPAAKPSFQKAPKFVLRQGSKSQNSTPLLPLRGRFRVSFLSSTRGLNVGRSVDVPLPSNSGPNLETALEELDRELVGIPALPFPIGF
ncbi:hypothetical protein AVEN_273004-1 [Araneus ventricosus]|uniref:Uncharacterized protein n=1 Tax=Araneus ventricosus TaxID=182803 RepID=A0A4Y2EYB1_ARAVE|nr:hypothetical protein AVEN_273004-1 [Araneus ventricosus]